MKKGIKKLELSKMTIANLNLTEMNQRVGGTGSCQAPPTTSNPFKPVIKK